METAITLEAVLAPSDDIVARDIEGEIIMVPLVSGISDSDDELYTLNMTGRAIWELLDGKRSLRNVVEALSEEYECPAGEIEQDVLGLATELLKRQLLIQVSQLLAE